MGVGQLISKDGGVDSSSSYQAFGRKILEEWKQDCIEENTGVVGTLFQMYAEAWSGELSLLENAPHWEDNTAYRYEQSCKKVCTGIYHVKEDSREMSCLFYLTVVYPSVIFRNTQSLTLCVQPSYKTQNCTSKKCFTPWRCGIDVAIPGSGPHHVGLRSHAVMVFGHGPLSMMP